MSLFPALLPILVLLSLGTGLKRIKLLSSEAWRGLERLGYYVFLPALIIKVLAMAPAEVIEWRFALNLLIAQIAIFLLGLIGLKGARISGPRFGSIIQSNVRWNTFVALALADVLFGSTGLALIALGAAILIPLANLFSILGFLYGTGKADSSFATIVQGLVQNPLLIACFIGGALWTSQITIPPLIGDVLDLLSRPAIALGLLTAGAGLTFRHVSTEWHETLFWSLFRLAVFPALALLLCWIFPLGLMASQIAIICAATPTAVNGYILAKELGGDHEFSASLIAVQTFLSLLTIPLFLSLTVWLIA